MAETIIPITPEEAEKTEQALRDMRRRSQNKLREIEANDPIKQGLRHIFASNINESREPGVSERFRALIVPDKK